MSEAPVTIEYEDNGSKGRCFVHSPANSSAATRNGPTC